MKKLTFYILLALIGWNTAALAQNVNGKITDPEGKALPGASVLLMSLPDSILTKFAIADGKGQFVLKGAKAGKYLLQVSFTGFKPLNKPLTLEKGKELSLGDVKLEEDKKMLKEIVVKEDRVPIVIKKDTIEYNSKAFRTKPNANVEKLLKQLPGVEVDKDGKVKAQGKEVKKVLVDGKEFFGKDPKIATKNLPADAIDKVQVFDDKSEMSKFTGVDDGDREKTINLVLKKNRKGGFFGNVSAGYGTDDRYNGKFNFNRFDSKTQISLLGGANNINEQPFSFVDYVGFVGGFQNISQGAISNIRSGGTSGLSALLRLNSSQALASTQVLGVNFNRDISKKTRLHANYFYNFIGNDINQVTDRETFVDSSTFFTNTTRDQTLRNWNHRANMRLDHNFGKKTRLRFYVDLLYNEGNNDEANITDNRLNDASVSQANSNTQANSQELGVNTRLLFRKRFGKRGRTLVFQGQVGTQNLESVDRLNNEQSAGILLPSLVTNQRQPLNNRQLNYDVQLSFIEPLGRGRFVEVKYQRNNFNNNSFKDFFNAGVTPETFIDSLSNRYTNDFTFDRGIVNFLYNKNNLNLTIGASAQYSTLNGVITTSETRIDRVFMNVLPSVRLRWRMAGSKGLNINYSTNINAPSMDQLRPVVDNSNPTNIFQGNPELDAEFVHRVNLNYYSFDQFSFTSIFGGFTGSYTQNKITNKVINDRLLNQFSQPVNVHFDANINGYLSYSTPLRWMAAKIRVNGNASLGQGIVFVNSVENTINRRTNSIRFTLENFRKKKMDIKAGATFSQNFTAYSDANDLDRTFMQEDYFVEGDLDLGKTWELGVNFTQSVFTGEAFTGGAQIVPLLRASLAKSFIQNRLQLKLIAFDILDRNQGITRNSSLNFVQEQRVQTIGRYFMVSLAYSFKALGKKGK
ncbi:hypothetical protein BKI52_25100 [marine bacterium AO1-C]|nr:hypothetical protein BKI52_25100 [marine bacterium AO1-C]